MPDAPIASAYLRLTDLVGAPLRAADGSRVGRITDLAVRLDDAFPAVSAVLVARRRRAAPVAIPVGELLRLDADGALLAGPMSPATAADDLLLLVRDVLDVQVVDTAGRRMARVGDVDLADDRGALRVIAVDVGWRAILRRLGLGRLARRASRDAIDWAGVHLAGGYGHPLQLAAPAAAVHRLDPAELAELLARLPVARGAEVLERVEATRAAAALAAVHPDLGADLVEVLAPARALALLDLLPDDEAADALRAADGERRAALLAAMGAPRRGALEALLAAPAPPPESAPRPPRRYWNVLRGHEGFWR